MEHVPILLMAGTAVAVSLLVFALTSWLGPKRMTREKALPYESGSESTGAQHVRLQVKFYLTAMLFVIFDVEAVFLYPWASQFRVLGWLGFWEMSAFLLVLSVTLLYAWRKGALEWQN